MNDRDSPILKPLWRRVALVAFCAAWTIWELWNGETMWATIVGVITAYGAWTFLIDYDSNPAKNTSKETDEQP